MIYEIRGKQIMLDSDLAELYECKNGTKTINQAVKRHINRFPERFMFQLTEEEYDYLRSQLGTAKYSAMSRTLPYAFTEQGIAMLSGLLKNNVAVQVSINIMDAFVAMRKFILTNGQLFSRLTTVEYKLLEHDKKFDEVFNELQRNEENKFQQQIFYSGQIYDAYSLIVDIIKSAKNKLKLYFCVIIIL